MLFTLLPGSNSGLIATLTITALGPGSLFLLLASRSLQKQAASGGLGNI